MQRFEISKRSLTNSMLFAIAVLLLVGGGPLTADAGCTSSSQCPSHMVCQGTVIPGIKECKQLFCNADSDCPSERPRCLAGACNAPAGTGGGTGGGTGLSDVGQPCGPYKIGQVTKSRGCKPNLQCVKGRCQRPEQ